MSICWTCWICRIQYIGWVKCWTWVGNTSFSSHHTWNHDDCEDPTSFLFLHVVRRHPCLTRCGETSVKTLLNASQTLWCLIVVQNFVVMFWFLCRYSKCVKGRRRRGQITDVVKRETWTTEHHTVFQCYFNLKKCFD